MQRLDFRHHRFIDGQTTSGIHQHHVVELNLGVFDGRIGDIDRFLIGARGEEVDLHLFRQRFELVDGRRTIDVCRHHQYLFLLALTQVAGQLGDGGGFTGPLQTRHQHHGRRALQAQALVGLAHDRFQLLLDDFDELLTWREAFRHLLADGALAYPFDERFDDRKRHVGFQQRFAHLAQGVFNIVVGQPCLAFDRLQRLGKTLTQILKHGASASVAVAGRIHRTNVAAIIRARGLSLHGRQRWRSTAVRRRFDWL